MMIKQNFKTSLNVCCFVDKVTGFGGGQVKEGKKALFLSHIAIQKIEVVSLKKNWFWRLF